MEFLRSAKRRTFVSELVYILLNVGLAVSILVVVWVVASPVPAFALVLLSKWRVLAVRPRYWFAHVQANMVDLIVSISLVVMLYVAGSGGIGDKGMTLQLILMMLYIGWLLLLKPRVKRSYVVAQAGTALFAGTTALYSVSYGWPSSIVVVVMFLIGYSVARHVLSAYSDDDLTTLSFIWGFVIAQLGWLAYHWTFAYTIPLVGIKLPQITIIVMAISFLAERIYASYEQHGTIHKADVLMPTLLSLGILAVVLTMFNALPKGGF